MKKQTAIISLFILMTIGMAAFLYEKQARAQNKQIDSQSLPMNSLPVEPGINPEDVGRQLPPLDTSPLPGFPVPSNPAANIGEQVASDRATEIASRIFKSTDSTVTESSLMNYEEAAELLLVDVETDDSLFMTSVWVIELSGSFQRSRRGPTQEESPIPAPTFSKAHIVLRAADGLVLITQTSK